MRLVDARRAFLGSPSYATSPIRSHRHREFLTTTIAAGSAALLGLARRGMAAESGRTLLAGEGVVDTTPPLGIELGGFHRAPGNERRIQGSRQPTAARALLPQLGGVQTAILSIDIATVYDKTKDERHPHFLMGDLGDRDSGEGRVSHGTAGQRLLEHGELAEVRGRSGRHGVEHGRVLEVRQTGHRIDRDATEANGCETGECAGRRVPDADQAHVP